MNKHLTAYAFGLAALLLGCYPQTGEKSLLSVRANAATIEVKAGDNLQAKIDAAAPGDTLNLAAGATFTGPIYLRKKKGDALITIQSSRASELPAGKRVTPDKAALMPKIISKGQADSALNTDPGAHHYKLIGLEIAQADANAFIYDLVNLGDGSEAQDTLAEVPHHLYIERCYIHAAQDGSLKRGIALNSAHTEILDSYVSGFKVKGQDSQAIGGWNGPGPFKIVNNYIEASGINVLFGGATGGLSATGMVPTGIEFKRNYVTRPMAWRGVWSVKNLFELKSAKNVVIDGNVFENNWTDAQSGTAILFTPRPSDSGPGALIEDVQFTNNIVRNIPAVFNLLRADYGYAPDSTGTRLKRIKISNNLVYNMDESLEGFGTFLLTPNGSDSVTVEHNTVLPPRSIMVAGGGKHTNFVFRNNLIGHGEYGIIGDGLAPGKGTLDALFRGAVIASNGIIGAPNGPFDYPGNFYPANMASVGFTNPLSNYRLLATSPYAKKGTDGKDLGVNVVALEAAQGGTTVTPPTPPKTIPKTTKDPKKP